MPFFLCSSQRLAFHFLLCSWQRHCLSFFLCSRQRLCFFCCAADWGLDFLYFCAADWGFASISSPGGRGGANSNDSISVVFSTIFSISQFLHICLVYYQAGVRGSWTEVGRTEKVSNSGRMLERCSKVLSAARLRKVLSAGYLRNNKVLRNVYFKKRSLSVTCVLQENYRL